jgi:uncharacterized protein (DUF488 family)
VHVLTIGHSTRGIDEFIALLKTHGVGRLVDIRTVPKSRRNPQFDTEALADSLKRAGIEYIHMSDLGGLRHPRKDSTNSAWRNDSFRGYADYMETPEFDHALERLLQLAAERRTTIMCAEAVPWRCHRSLVADAIVACGHDVEHILGDARLDRHMLTPFARIEGRRVTYPGVI